MTERPLVPPPSQDLEWLTRENRLCSAILETAGALVVVFDREGRIVRFNRACEETTGYAFAEVRGRPIWEVLLLPEEAEAVRGVFRKLAAGQYPSRFENSWRTKDGRRRLIAWVNTAVLDERGEVELVVGTGLDVTDREQALAWSRRIIQTAMDGFWLTDLEGRILDVNEAYCELVGYSREELLDRRISDIEAEETAEETRAHIAKIIRSGRDRFETRHRRKDGRMLDVEVSVNYADVAGGRFFVFVRDITERKRALEETRLRNAELEAANLELDAFSYSISHDLRSPLIAIDGLTRLAAGRVDEEAGRWLDEIAGAARRANRLIDDLLEFSRSGHQALRLELVDMSRLTAEVRAEIEGRHPERTVQFVLKPLPAAHGDPALLRQVWRNLLLNAWKFTATREAAKIEVSGRVGEGETLYTVADNGVGFDPADAAVIFEPFRQGRRTGGPAFEGSGIGLAIVKRIVDRHGGRIRAEGFPGAGAAIHFALPDGGDAPGTD